MPFSESSSEISSATESGSASPRLRSGWSGCGRVVWVLRRACFLAFFDDRFSLTSGRMTVSQGSVSSSECCGFKSDQDWHTWASLLPSSLASASASGRLPSIVVREQSELMSDQVALSPDLEDALDFAVLFFGQVFQDQGDIPPMRPPEWSS